MVLLAGGACAYGFAAPSAAAFNPIKPICGAAELASGLAGKVCTVVQHGGRVLQAGKKLATGHVGGAVKTAVGSAGSSTARDASAALALAAVGAWVLGGAKFVLHETGRLLSETSSPQLQTTWFSSTYWRIAAIAAVLTLPFLFAAAVQALLRSDLSLLARASLGYLPLAMLAVSVAAPVAMLLLAASDQLSAVVSSAAGDAGGRFLDRASLTVGALTILSGSPFLAFFVGVLTVAGAVVLWIELLIRQAAVYVIVLMLPLAFAAMVWPARRIWAIRSVELLVALILSKFAMVAVLSLGGAAMGQGHTVAGALAGLVLIVLGAFAPWALLRLLPLADLASGAAAGLRSELRAVRPSTVAAGAGASEAEEWAASTMARMRRDLDAARANGAHIDRALPPITPNGSASQEPAGSGDEDADASNRAGAAELIDSLVPGAPGDPVPEPGLQPEPQERVRGMGPMWQARDMTWRPLRLGLEEGWPPPAVWPPEGEGSEAAAHDEDHEHAPSPR